MFKLKQCLHLQHRDDDDDDDSRMLQRTQLLTRQSGKACCMAFCATAFETLLSSQGAMML
jgi:hypothetical protein